METSAKLLFPSTRAAKHCVIRFIYLVFFDAFFIFIFSLLASYTATSICALKIPFFLFYLELFLQAEVVYITVCVILVPRNSSRESAHAEGKIFHNTPPRSSHMATQFAGCEQATALLVFDNGRIALNFNSSSIAVFKLYLPVL